jgi:hypothetical protein
MPKPSSKDEGFLLPVASDVDGLVRWVVDPAASDESLVSGVMLSKVLERRLTRWWEQDKVLPLRCKQRNETFFKN